MVRPLPDDRAARIFSCRAVPKRDLCQGNEGRASSLCHHVARFGPHSYIRGSQRELISSLLFSCTFSLLLLTRNSQVQEDDGMEGKAIVAEAGIRAFPTFFFFIDGTKR